MSDQILTQRSVHLAEATDWRRRQLRALLLTAADAARQSRRIPAMAARVTQPVGRAVRDRISMLLSAAG